MRNRLASRPRASDRHARLHRKETRIVRRGYVLLAVLAVLVLVMTALTTLSKLSLNRALAAADAQRRLQQRLGANSIEQALLPRAAGIFDRLEKQSEERRVATGTAVPFPKTIRQAVTLNGVTYDVMIADEDAKLNLNQIYHLVGPARTQSAIAEVVGPSARRVIRLTPATRPMKEELMAESVGDQDDESAPSENAIPRAFRSWGEVFDLTALSAAFGNDAALPNLTGEITCWGSGAVNIRRASDKSIQAAAAGVLSQAGADRFVSRYRENPTGSLEVLIQREANSETDRRRLRKMISETSTHFSLWIDASTTARKSLRSFSVLQQSDEGTTTNERFDF